MTDTPRPTYLLDTHVVLWLAVDPQQIPARLRAKLEAAERILVSAASVYELAQKVRLGKLPAGAGVLARWQELLEKMGAEELPLSTAEMTQAGLMQWEHRQLGHRDPFDRMLAAQAQLGGLRLVTKDTALVAFPGISCAEWA